VLQVYKHHISAATPTHMTQLLKQPSLDWRNERRSKQFCQ